MREYYYTCGQIELMDKKYLYAGTMIVGGGLFVFAATLGGICVSYRSFGWIVFAMIGLGLVLAICDAYRKLRYTMVAEYCSKYFAQVDTSVVAVGDLPFVKRNNSTKVVKRIQGAIKKGFLQKCTLESRDGCFQMVLEKQAGRNCCPACGVLLDGPINRYSQCQYCGSKFMDV